MLLEKCGNASFDIDEINNNVTNKRDAPFLL